MPFSPREFWWRFQLSKKLRDSALVQKLMRHGVVAARVRGAAPDVRVSIPGTGLEARMPQEEFLLEAESHLHALHTVGGECLRADSGAFRLKIDDVTLEPVTAEEILIAREIFVDGVYHYLPSEPVWIWDIGCNVGTAAVFFSRLPQVVHVHGFEPLAENRARAAQNFSLNPHLKGRITVHPHAVGLKDGSLIGEYASDHRGSFSLARAPAEVERLHGRGAADLRRESISLVAAAPTLQQLRARQPGIATVVKMDCEGAEREILRALADADELRNIRALLIETHEGCGRELAELLGRANFDVLIGSPLSKDLGYLVAFNARPASE